MKGLRPALNLALVLLGSDLLLILVTGGTSFLGDPVSPWGFGARLLLLGGAFTWRTRLLPAPERRISGSRLLLGLLLLPTLAEFQYAGGRINGDGVMYYVYVRSLWKDFDLDFTDEYTHYGLITRGDLAVHTKTGLRRSIFAIGPAVVWTPFFGLGELVARGEHLLGRTVELDGYGPDHRNAVALGSLLYGFIAVLLIHDLLRRHFGERAAIGAALLAWGATFLHWYMVVQPTMSHADSAFGAAVAVWLWERQRGRRSRFGFFLLGLVMGLAMCIRWQNGVLLILPALDLLEVAWKDPRRLGGCVVEGLLVLCGAGIGAFPQMAAWKALYDMWVLPYPPHGTDFLRLDHPFILETLFSSRHGLLSWTPVFWAGYLGFLPLIRRRPRIALPLLVPLVLMTYVNMCSGDWWAGGSFSNRRFDSLLPILAFGFAAALETARAFLARRPGAALAMLAVPLVTWNLLLAEQVRRGLVPRDDTVAFRDLVYEGSRVFSQALGSPNTWPASWLFALETGRPPGQYDELVGRYLFYRQNSLRGHVELGVPGDEAMLGEGWGRIEHYGDAGVRRILGRARFFAPLDVPIALELRIRAAATTPAAVRVRVNGREVGGFWAGPGLGEHVVRAGAGFWHREINDVVLESAGDGVLVDAVDFTREEP